MNRKPLDPMWSWLATLLAIDAALLTFGVFMLADSWKPAWVSWLITGAALFYLTGHIWTLIGFLRSDDRTLRQALITLTAQRQDTWLNRDLHLIFHGFKHGRHPALEWSVVRMDEELQHELDKDGPVKTAFTYERFTLPPHKAGVIRTNEARMIEVDADGKAKGSKLPGAPGILTRWRRTRQISRDAGLGTSRATPDELRELVGQLENAEHIADPA